jgi:[CysO sulfur-carrier protein]-S-L-cysteine hydrolase
MSDPDLEIPAHVLDAIYDQARAEFPNECCGYLRGRGSATTLVQCTNYQDRLHKLDPEAYPRTAANGYNFGGKQQLGFATGFDGDDPPTVIYHSHPRVGAYFSREDEAAALSAGWSVDYLVVDVQDAEIRESVLFRRDPNATAEGPAFVPIARFPGKEV